MAGIGFKISKMLRKESLTLNFLAFVYSALVTVGPWIISSLSVWIIMKYVNFQDNYFQASLIYSFIFSVIMTGGINLVFTRRLSDLVYSNRIEKIFPEFLSSGFLVFIILLTSSIIFFYVNPHPIWFIVLSTWFYISIGFTWFLSILMTETKKLGIYTIGYVIFGTSGVILVKILGDIFKSKGGLVGFLMADIICLSIFTFVVGKTFGFRMKISFEWVKESLKYWELYIIGWIYYFSIWIDDFVVWMSKHKYVVLEGFVFSPKYDISMFFAYLTIIPTLIMIVVVIETKFYRRYKEFYNVLSEGARLSVIKIKHRRMMEDLNYSISMTVKIQSVFTGFFILLNETGIFEKVLQLSKDILRMGLIGAMMNGFFLVVILILLYFEFKREALFSTVMTFVLNLNLSLYFLNTYGFKMASLGYAMAFSVGFIVSYTTLKNRLRDLIRIEYLRQPIGLPKGYVKYEKYNPQSVNDE